MDAIPIGKLSMIRPLLVVLLVASTICAQDGFPLPDGVKSRFGNRQMRHPEPVAAVAASPDGNLVATLSQTCVVVWDAKTLNARCVIRDPRLSAYSGDRSTRLAFFPDSKSLLVSLRYAGSGVINLNDKIDLARVYDLETGKPRFTITGQFTFEASAWLAEDGKEIVVAPVPDNGVPSMKAYDAKEGKLLRSAAMKSPAGQGMFGSSSGRDLWISPDGRRVARLSDQRDTLTLVDAKSGEILREIATRPVIQLAFSPDAGRIYLHDNTGKVTAHDLAGKKELFSFDHPASKQHGPMRVSKDGGTLFFGGQHGQLFRWDLKGNKPLPNVGRHSTWTLSALALSPDEKTLYSVGGDRLLRRWDVATGKQHPLPEGYITQTAVMPTVDGKHLVVADHQGAIDLWSLETGKVVQSIQASGKGAGIDCLDASHDGRWLAAGRTVQDVQVWDLTAGKLERTIPLVGKPDAKGGDHVKRVRFSPDGRVLFTQSNKTGVTAWETATGKELWRVPMLGPCLAVSPDGKRLAVAGGFGDAIDWHLLDAASGAVLRKVSILNVEDPDGAVGYRPYVSDIAFSPDGSRLLSTHYDNRLRLWHVESGRSLGAFTAKDKSAYGQRPLAWSPDGRWIAVAHIDRTLHLWEVATMQEVLTLPGPDSLSRELAFTRDGRGLIANADLSPTLWLLAPKTPPKDARADAAWADLADADAVKSYERQWVLAATPETAVRLLSERVKPAELSVPRADFDRWVADLDSPRFQVREKAEKAMADAGFKLSVAWLREARAGAGSDELRERLDRALRRRETPDAAERRLGRCVHVLELAGTPEAKALLKEWAAVPGTPLTESAAAALARMR